MLTIHTEELRKVMKDLWLSTSIQCALFDERGRIICEYPQEIIAFCRTVREVPALKEKCFACDRYGFDRASASKNTCMYYCHMGLTECVAPIIKNGTLIGYLMLGQSVAMENIPQIQKMISDFPKPEKRDDLREYLKELPHFSEKKLTAIAKVAQMCTSYLWLMDLISMRGNPMAFAIAEYISNHLSEDLSVETLCCRFGISKTSLYLLSKECYGSGITAYICKQRIERAMLLLEEKRMSISDTAQAVGYMDTSYFTRVFREHTGYSPLKWLKQREI